MENDADLWDKFALSLNWLTENIKDPIIESDTIDLLG